VRLATWNVNGLRARLDFVKIWLRERRPDVVGLQELKCLDEHFPRDAFAELGYQGLAFCQKGWNGVAVLAREELALKEVARGLAGQDGEGARLLVAEAGGIVFATVYAPNGKSVGHPDFPRKIAWLDALAQHVEKTHRPEQPLVLGGDFNLCPAPLDSWNEAALRGQIFHTDEERACFRALLDWGLADVFRERHPDAQAFSWWDYRAGAFHRRQGLRIDFLLATRAVLGRVTAVEIDRDFRKKQDGLTPSDHAPVWMDLDAAG
jgi:exodeoxyribonuclease-3